MFSFDLRLDLRLEAYNAHRKTSEINAKRSGIEQRIKNEKSTYPGDASTL